MSIYIYREAIGIWFDVGTVSILFFGVTIACILFVVSLTVRWLKSQDSNACYSVNNLPKAKVRYSQRTHQHNYHVIIRLLACNCADIFKRYRAGIDTSVFF